MYLMHYFTLMSSIFCQPRGISKAVGQMNSQTKHSIFEDDVSSDSTVDAENFEHWAKAVRQQMLACLRKRGEQSQQGD
jgi:hypothetical protein